MSVIPSRFARIGSFSFFRHLFNRKRGLPSTPILPRLVAVTLAYALLLQFFPCRALAATNYKRTVTEKRQSGSNSDKSAHFFGADVSGGISQVESEALPRFRSDVDHAP